MEAVQFGIYDDILRGELQECNVCPNDLSRCIEYCGGVIEAVEYSDGKVLLGKQSNSFKLLKLAFPEVHNDVYNDERNEKQEAAEC